MRTPSSTFTKAFTLVELLASILVLTLLMSAVIAILTSATTLTGQSRKHIDADSEARTVFDRMAGDFNGMVNRTDVDYLFKKGAGNETFFFTVKHPRWRITPTSPRSKTPVLWSDTKSTASTSLSA